MNTRLLSEVIVWTLLALLGSSRVTAADVTSVWNGGTGSWNEPTNWFHAPLLPGVDYPDNDTVTYDVEIGSGSVALVAPVTVQSFIFSGGTLTGAGITASNPAVWTGGFLDLSAPFVARGGLAIVVAETNFNRSPFTTMYGLSSITGPGTIASETEWSNEGTLVLSNDVQFVRMVSSGKVPIWRNRGILRAEGPGVIRFHEFCAFQTTGELDVRSGGFVTPRYAAYSGLIRCASNSFVEIVNEFVDPAFPSNTVFAGPGSMHITNGGYENARASAAGSFVLSNSAKVEVSAGTLLLQGPAMIQAGSSIQLSGPGRATLSAAALTNLGTIAFTRIPTQSDLRPMMDGKIFNAGLIDFQDDFVADTFGMPRLENFGVIQKSAGPDTTRFKLAGNNQGLMAVRSGTLILEGAITNYGRFLAETNCRLIIKSDVSLPPPVDLREGTRIEGDGTNTLSRFVVLSGHSTNAGTLELGYVVPGDETSISLSGTGVLHNTGTLITRNGSSRATIQNEGLLIQRSEFSGRIDNAGVLQVEQDTFGAYQYSSLTGLVENTGTTIKRTGATWQTAASTIFNNRGVFDLQEGVVNWSASGSHSGTFITAAGRTNTFLNATNHFLVGASMAGAGRMIINGGQFHIDGSVTNTGSLVLEKGTLAGAGDLVNESGGEFSWKDGALLGSGEIIIQAGATAVFGKSFQADNDRLEKRIVNHGVVQTIGSSATGPGRVENFGTMRVGGASFRFDGSGFAPPLINFGNLIVESNRHLEAFRCTNSGTVRFERGSLLQSFFLGGNVAQYVQTGGETIFDHATNYFTRMLFLGGAFTGEGRIYETLTVTNTSLEIGFPIGRLYVDALGMASNSILNIDLGGTQPGVSHDQVTVGLAVSPGSVGIIHVRLANGFAPQLGDRFTILNGFLSFNMDFRFRGLNLGNGLRLAPYRTSSELTLVVVPAPTSNAVPKLTMQDQNTVRLSWPPDLQGFQILSATNLAGPWQPFYSYTGPEGQLFLQRKPKEFFRLVDLEVP
jgi:hypothetical protein